MRKITLMVIVSLLSFCSYGQLALEGFETPWTGTPKAPPGGWVVLNEEGEETWVQSTAGNTTQQPVYEGNHAAYLQRENVNPGSPIPSNWLITKQFNSPLNGELHFFSRLTQLNDQGGIYKTMIALAPDSTTPVENLTWVDLQTWTELALNPSQLVYTEKIVGIPTVYTNQQIRIAFIMQGDNKDRWLIDNVEVMTRCVAPSSVKVTDITLDSAKINWVTPNGVSSWEIEIVKDVESPTGTGVTYNGTLPYFKNGLDEDTAYKFYIRSNCDGNSKSGWVGPFYFSTLLTGENCTAPIIIPPALPYTTNNNTANFSDVFESQPGTSCNGVDDYLAGNDVVYTYTPTASGTIQVSLSNTGNRAGVYIYNSCANIGNTCINGVAATATAAGVIPALAVTAGTTYYIIVSTDGTPQITPYTLTLQQVNCTAPTGLTANALTATSANLSWAAGTATSWQAVIQNVGTGLPTGVGQTINTNTGYTATQTTAGAAFAPATNYEYYLRADCGNGTFSTWTGPYTFATTQIPASLNYLENFDANSNGWSLSNGAQPNKWYVGVATSSSPSKSLYISNDNGLSNNYTVNENSTVHAYRDINIPADAKQISIAFDLKVAGEKTNDYVKVWLVPTSYIPTPGTPITALSGRVQVGTNLNLFPTWTNQVLVADATPHAGSVGRLIFEWRNNNYTGTQNAAAIDNVNVSLVTCSAPTVLTLGTMTSTSANFSWTAFPGTSPTGYEYYYTTNILTIPTASTVVSGNSATTNTTIPSLTSGETYYVWVRSTCGADKSYWTGPVSVTIPQVPATIDYSENFDSGTHGFSLINGSQPNKWVIGNATSNSGSKSLYISNDNGTTNSYNVNNMSTVHAYRDVLIPATAGELTVSFDFKSIGAAGDYFKVWMVPVTYAPTAGSQTFNGTDRVQLGGIFNLTNTWSSATFNTPVLPAYKNTVRRLLIEWRNDGADGVQPPAAIDNISIIVTECPKPQNLTAINIDNNTVKFDWDETGTATNWEVFVIPNIDATLPPEPVVPGIPVTGTSEYTPVAGTIIHNIPYVYYVRSNCGGTTGFSQWAGPFKFALTPANDECVNSTTVLTNPTLVCTETAHGSVVGATKSLEQNDCSSTAASDDDIWFDFVATSTTHIINYNNITGSDNFLRAGIYSGTDCATLTELTCIQYNNTFVNGLTVGDSYKIRIWTSSNVPGQTTEFDLCITTPPPPPVNDECASATPVIVNPTFVCNEITAGTLFSATPSAVVENECDYDDGVDDVDVWYSFVATNTSHRINLLNSTTLSLAIYSGDPCGTADMPLACVTYDDQIWADNLTIGETYKIRVYSSTENSTSTFDVCVSTPPAAPANDNCANAVVVPVNSTMACVQTVPGTIESATPSPEDNTCEAVANEDVWYQFTATSTTHNIELKDITGSTTDLFHVVYSGDQCGTMTQLYCSDANYSVAAGLTLGQVYKIRVYAYDGLHQTTKFNVCVSTPLPPAANDECANAIVVPINPDSSCNLVTSGNVFGATASPEANECDGSTDDDIWFEFVATDTVHIITLMNIEGSATDLDHAVYSGDQCGSLLLLSCTDVNSSTVGGLIVGNTYKVRVYTKTEEPNQSTTFDICIKRPNTPIIVNTGVFTTEQLIKEVLINSECALVSNITAKTGTAFGQAEGVGYFDANGADFPFDYGVVLSTGNVNLAQGPFTGIDPDVDTGLWLGDDQLNDIILADNPAKNRGTKNATMLEFDFVPLTNTFKFNFLFASNEYGEFQCQFTDAFAFILTDQNGVSQNLAVLPNTNIPVGVTTIRDGQNNMNCDSVNPEYFGQYNVDAPIGAAINYRGQTVPLLAKATVIPGEIYHIKLVIADYDDALLSSAVFLDGGSFDIGELELGGDLLVEDGTALCESETAILDTKLTGPNYIITWYKDGVLIPGATAPTYEVTESGTYGVKATFADVACSYEGSVIVEIFPAVEDITGNPIDLTVCDATGFSTFDLTPSVNAILAGTTIPANFVNTIHLTEADAKSGDNPIADITAYTNVTIASQTLWVRTVQTVSGCFGVKSFNLIVQDLTPNFTITPDFSICEGTSRTIDVVITDTDITAVTYTWTKDGTALPDTTPSITVTQTGVYVVTLNRMGCETSSTVNVTVLPVPVADTPVNVAACDSYTLPALTSGNYFTGTNGTGTALFANDAITQTTTVYVFADNGVCSDENTFEVRITPTPAFSLGDTQNVCVASVATINVTQANFDVNAATYVWTLDGAPISGNNSIVASGFGKYEVTVTINDCTHTESVVITQDTTAIALILTNGCEDNSYMIAVTDDNDSFNIDTATYAWTGPQGFVSTEREFVATKTGTYTVIVTTPEGCVGEKSVDVADTSCNIQRGISPNGDGLNDNFELSTLNVKKLSIFNRYGQEVYSKGNYKNEWNGQGKKGDELPTGTYFYTIELQNGDSTTGWIYINRQE